MEVEGGKREACNNLLEVSAEASLFKYWALELSLLVLVVNQSQETAPRRLTFSLSLSAGRLTARFCSTRTYGPGP